MFCIAPLPSLCIIHNCHSCLLLLSTQVLYCHIRLSAIPCDHLYHLPYMSFFTDCFNSYILSPPCLVFALRGGSPLTKYSVSQTHSSAECLFKTSSVPPFLLSAMSFQYSDATLYVHWLLPHDISAI